MGGYLEVIDVSYINIKGNHNGEFEHLGIKFDVSYINIKGNHNNFVFDVYVNQDVSYINIKGNHNSQGLTTTSYLM